MSSHLDPQPDERARARDAANRDRYAIRRTLRGMTAELHRLEREAHDFGVRAQDTKDAIEEIWLVEHWGKESVQPPAWRNERQGRRAPTTSAGGRRAALISPWSRRPRTRRLGA